MRILADMADVKELKKAFQNNQDIHSLTASQVFDVPINKVSDDFRRKAKAINFGIIYGITQYGLAKQIAVANHEAQDFINAYFKKFPEIKDYMNSTVKTCRKQGYVTNIFGRRIHLRGINDKNFSVRSFQERAAINAPIQGSAADQIKKAMVELHKEDIIPMIQIHDELAISVDGSKEQQDKIIEVMENCLEMEISSKVDVAVANNWGETQ